MKIYRTSSIHILENYLMENFDYFNIFKKDFNFSYLMDFEELQSKIMECVELAINNTIREPYFMRLLCKQYCFYQPSASNIKKLTKNIQKIMKERYLLESQVHWEEIQKIFYN